MISTSLQIFGFVILLSYFFTYLNERKGIEKNSKIFKGAKLFRDENGVKIK